MTAHEGAGVTTRTTQLDLMRIYWISNLEFGRLGIMPRPRGGDWLEDEIRSLEMSGVDAVVSLLEAEEITELGVAEEKSLCEANGISYLSFPIKDRNTPLSKRDALDFARMLANLLRNGRSVTIHCRQSVGRSALVAACVLVLSELSVDDAFEKIENARGCSVPDTKNSVSGWFNLPKVYKSRGSAHRKSSNMQ